MQQMYLLGRKYYIKRKELIVFYTNANNIHAFKILLSNTNSVWSLLNNNCNNSAKANFMKANYYNVLYWNNSLNAEKLWKTIIRIWSFGTQCIKGVNDLLIDLLNDLLFKNNHLHFRWSLRKFIYKIFKE